MKKILISALILTLAVFSASSQEKLEVGKPVPKWAFPDANGNEYTMDSWKGKVLQMNYVDPDEEALNDPFNDAVNKAADIDKIIDKEYFKGFGIVDSKSTWKPNGVIRMIAKKKEKKYGTTVLFDYDGVLHDKWGAPMDSYTIVIADKNRICRAVYKGEVPDEEIEDIIKMIIELTKE
jgi:predicted transcriptional regulator